MKNTPSPDRGLSLEDVDVTSRLAERPSRAPQFEVELAALKSLSAKLTELNADHMQELSNKVLEICGAESAGISLIETESGHDIFRWQAISGKMRPYLHGTMPRDFSPCGVVVDRGEAVLLDRPARHWLYIEKIELPMEEVLLTPFFRNGRAVGTLWAIFHQPQKKFDAEDLRLIRSLADMAGLIVDTANRLKRFTSEHSELERERDVSRDEQSWLREAIDRIPKPIFFLNLDKQEMWFSNQAAQKMLGFRYEDEMSTAREAGRVRILAVDGRELDSAKYPSRRALRGESILGEQFIVESVGGRYHIRAFAEQLPAVFGHPRTAIILLQDITALKEAESELIKTQAALKEAVEVAQIGFWTLEIGTQKMSVTPVLRRQFGLSDTDEFGNLEQALARVHPEDRNTVERAIARAVNEHAPYQITYRVLQDNGSVRWIEAKGALMYDEAGHPERFAGTTIDLTDATLARQEAESARMKAEVASITKSQFLANMSHEIRSPLGAIVGFSDLARQPEATREEISGYLSIIDRNSVQVLRIIDDILDLSKVEAGRMDVEMMEVALPEFVADFSSLFGFRARENGITFLIQAETDLPTVICTDPTRLRQILNNAVGNAIKFTAKGKVTLHLCYREGLLEFGIEDTGRGISDAQAAELFQPFVQADTSTTRKFGGTGLGLVLTRHLCRLLGGDYKLVRSTPGGGSLFKATVAANLPSEARLVPKEKVIFESHDTPVMPASKRELDEVRVLLVEDSPDNQVLIRLILERQGVRLDIAGDGASGVKMALAGAHDVVLMDIQMPQMDGHEAVRALRKAGYTRPIVALTAHAMKEESERARVSGFTDFLTKPIHRETLIEKVKTLARGKA